MIREKRVPFLVPQAGESTGYIRGSSGLGQNADGVVYKNEVEFRHLWRRRRPMSWQLACVKLCRNVITPDITGSAPARDQAREAFRIRSGQLKTHFRISTIPIHEMSLETLLAMVINRDQPFEQIELSKIKHVIVVLQDTHQVHPDPRNLRPIA